MKNIDDLHHIAVRTEAWLSKTAQHCSEFSIRRRREGGFYGEIGRYCHLHLGLQGFWRGRQTEKEKERAKKISGDGPVSSTHSENVQTGRLEPHRWPDTHRRSIMKLWRRQRLLGVCCRELGLRCWCEDTVCVCVSVSGGVFLSLHLKSVSLFDMKGGETSWWGVETGGWREGNKKKERKNIVRGREVREG